MKPLPHYCRPFCRETCARRLKRRCASIAITERQHCTALSTWGCRRRRQHGSCKTGLFAEPPHWLRSRPGTGRAREGSVGWGCLCMYGGACHNKASVHCSRGMGGGAEHDGKVLHMLDSCKDSPKERNHCRHMDHTPSHPNISGHIFHLILSACCLRGVASTARSCLANHFWTCAARGHCCTSACNASICWAAVKDSKCSRACRHVHA